MSIPAIAIRNPVFAWMLMAFFIVFGAISFMRLPQGQYPDIDFPVITLNATLEGAAPEIMESDVVDVLEDAVNAVEGIREMKSVCKQGQATITIEFDLARSIDIALQDVQARVSQAAKLLPREMDPVIINKTNPEEQPIMWVALSGTRSQQEITEYAKNALRDKFLTVEGNGDVMMGGYLARNVRIWIDSKKLEQLGLSADDLINAAQHEHVEVPAGRLEGSMRESNVQVEGEALNTEQLLSIVIAIRNGQPVYLRDVAVVEDGFEDRRRIARSNGFPAQGLGIIKQHGSNTVDVAKSVRARIAELRKTLPAGLELDVRVDNSQFIKQAVDEIELTLVLAVLLTAVVCWFFLGSLSSTFNVLLAIPVSVFGTFIVMYFAGFSLNTFTLLALSLSIGIVVDDAVMILENIYRHAEMGKDKATASREGAEQISFAALAATLAIIAIFLPVAFMTGMIGKFFFQFGVVLSVAVAISLLEALTLAPARCAQFLKVGHRGNFIERFAGAIFDWLSMAYRASLNFVLELNIGPLPFGQLAVMALAGALFFWSLTLIGPMPKEMVPAQDQGYYMLRVIAPVGSTVDYTDKVMKHVETIMASHEEFESNLVIAGGIGGDVNVGIAFVTLKELDERKAQQEKYLAEVRKDIEAHPVPKEEEAMRLQKCREAHPATQMESMNLFRKEMELNPSPGSRVIVIDFSQAGFASSSRGGLSIEYTIRGPSWDKLGSLSEKFMDEMKSSGVFVDVDTDYRKGMPEIQVIPDREKCMTQNVDIKALADTVGVLVGGQKIGRFKDNGRRYDVRARLLQSGRSRLEDIGDLYIRAKDKKLVRISDVARIELRPSLQSITRQDRERAVTMMANPEPHHSQDDCIKMIEKFGKDFLPEGYTVHFGGSAKAFVESFSSLITALILGLIVAYMVLASQFNSFMHPITVLLALPFSISGALIALSVSHQSLNVFSMIGLILLMGIVKKNSILLVDFTNQLRAEGKDRKSAILEGCPTRLRPILMTTVATIAGAIPGAVMTGPGSETRIPMCMAVIGGLTVSTVLTLFVVPCFYNLMDGVQSWIFAPKKKSAEAIMKEPDKDHYPAEASAAGK